jgi:hypothetical protein
MSERVRDSRILSHSSMARIRIVLLLHVCTQVHFYVFIAVCMCTCNFSIYVSMSDVHIYRMSVCPYVSICTLCNVRM